MENLDQQFLTVIFDLFGNFFYSTLYSGLTGDTLLDFNFQRKGFSWTSIAPAILMLPSSLGRDFGTNGPLWSLAYEVVYYMIYPLWLSVRRLGIVPAYGLAIVLTIAAGYYSLDDGFFKSVLIHYPIWLSGALIAELFNKIKLNRTHIFISIILLVFSILIIQIKLSLMFLILSYSILGCSVVTALCVTFRYKNIRQNYYIKLENRI